MNEQEAKKCMDVSNELILRATQLFNGTTADFQIKTSVLYVVGILQLIQAHSPNPIDKQYLSFLHLCFTSELDRFINVIQSQSQL